MLSVLKSGGLGLNFFALVGRESQGDELVVKVNKLTSINTELPYKYHSLPSCKLNTIVDSANILVTNETAQDVPDRLQNNCQGEGSKEGSLTICHWLFELQGQTRTLSLIKVDIMLVSRASMLQ